MVQEIARADLPEPRRKELFHRLVLAQDFPMTVAEARQMACDLFAVVEQQVLQMEKEGLERDWPPL